MYQQLDSASRSKIIQHIYQLVPVGSPEPTNSETLAILSDLTSDLIGSYAPEELVHSPFDEVCKRRPPLYESEIARHLASQIVLITGGEGFVGSQLIEKLCAFNVKSIISIDNVRCPNRVQTKLVGSRKIPLVQYAADVRDYEEMKRIFEMQQPGVVFHLAAQRLPGLAEVQVRDTITTNVFGTQNIIELSELYNVNYCIFSSTGKASKYVTSDIYAGSKKLAEWLFAAAAQVGRVRYGMVRFTHVVENSPVSAEIDRKIQRGIVDLHSANRFMHAQSVAEAVHLLLNALVFADRDRFAFLVIKDLGWPINVLEIALHKIRQTQEAIPLYFRGVPAGYEEYTFQGQFDWNRRDEISSMVNVLELALSTVDDTGKMIVAELAPFSIEVMRSNIIQLRQKLDDIGVSDTEIRALFVKANKEIVRSIFRQAPPQALLNILKWGINPKRMQDEGITIDAYRDTVELLVQGLHGRVCEEDLLGAKIASRLDDIIDIISHLPTIQDEVVELRHKADSLKALKTT